MQIGNNIINCPYAKLHIGHHNVYTLHLWMIYWDDASVLGAFNSMLEKYKKSRLIVDRFALLVVMVVVMMNDINIGWI